MMQMMRVHAPEKNCCRSRQPEIGRFAPRGFGCRAEDKETVGEHKPFPLDFDMTILPLYPPVQEKPAGEAVGGQEHAFAASSQRRWGLNAPRFEMMQAKPQPNRTGMPDRLKAGIESLSGIDMSDVRVHANSDRPARLNALAYTKGNQIHIAPGQGRHLAHEAWHAVQQKQGRVRATTQLQGVGVNDDAELENEADLMGGRALQMREEDAGLHDLSPSSQVVQAYGVGIFRGPTHESDVTGELLAIAIRVIEQILEAVESTEGAAASGEEHQRLTRILEEQAVKETLPESANSTYGLGGSNFLSPFTTTQGTRRFSVAVSTIPAAGETQHLGQRARGVHDEMKHISDFPGLQALASSQGHCFFCFGTAESRGYQHGEIREDPWPKKWQHDYLGFKLTQTSTDLLRNKNDPVISITSDIFGTRYYFVSKL